MLAGGAAFVSCDLLQPTNDIVIIPASVEASNILTARLFI
jgi:hypothetical protein